MGTSVLVWGAGAIGGTIGAHLVRQGHAVVFVDRVGEHVERIRDGKLSIDGPVSGFTVGAPAFLPDALEGRYDLILLAVKAQHTEEAARMLAPHLSDAGAVVSCQNGLNEPTIAGIVGRERTIGAFVNFGADWIGPGHITFGGRGAVVVGELDGKRTPRIEAIHRLLQDFESNAVLTDNIYGYLWSKLAYGTILKAQALTDETIADFLADPDMRPLIIGLVREVLAIAVAEGIRPMPFQGFDPAVFMRNDRPAIDAAIAATIAGRRHSAKVRSGIWRDLAVRKRPTEVAYQLAPVIAAGRRHRLPTAALEHLVELISSLERGERGHGRDLALRLGETVAEGGRRERQAAG